MGLFNLFKKREPELSEEQKKWNQMWSNWADGKAVSPYAELMTYQSEIYNGGHEQYFSNVGEPSAIEKELSALDTILPAKLKKNLHAAYKAYLALEANADDEKAENAIEHCDDVFYDNEEDVNCILREYASKTEL